VVRGFLARLAGVAEAELASGEPEELLTRCGEAGIPVWQVRRRDGCSLILCLWERDFPLLQTLAEENGAELRLLSLRGGSSGRARLRARRVLLAALLLAAGLLLSSSLFVWEVEVRGCEKLTEGRVLRALAECGVERGTYWPGVSPELVRSRMLTRVPDLAWMTVNFSGSRAVVLVQERQERPEIYREDSPAEIRASASGVIRRVTVLNGRCLVQPGDAVLAGELLISGEMESLTDPIPPQRAMGEVWAETWYELSAACPLDALKCGTKEEERGRLAVQIGKKRWILWGNGKKGLDECGKIVHEYNLGIKGLFALPVSLIRESGLERHPGASEEQRAAEMRASLLRRLEGQIDGEILESSFSVSRTDDLLIVTLRAHCFENIAQTVEQ
jgi:similar to stage IV sporulation protein